MASAAAADAAASDVNGDVADPLLVVPLMKVGVCAVYFLGPLLMIAFIFMPSLIIALSYNAFTLALGSARQAG
jgi:hypothetical protein